MAEKNTNANDRATAQLAGEGIARSAAAPRIGIHLSTAGGAHTAVERAVAAGANTFQIFTSSPRMWKAAPISAEVGAKIRALREKHAIGPAVVHANYLINLASQTDDVRQKSSTAFRGEVERAIALGAEFLVLHPGSWKGLTREEGLQRAAAGIEQAVDGLNLEGSGFQLLIENTAGSEHSLGGSFEQVAELVAMLRAHLPVGVCLDTCHTHVAGYDIVSEAGWQQTVALIDSTIGTEHVKVWHTNDAKAARGSKLDRHEHIGQGMIGGAPFGRLLRDPRFAHCAFIAETPVDEPEDIERNVQALRGLYAAAGPR
jgi:deoxyribonuclease-4